MSDGAISQDEIDALLSGVSVDGLSSSGKVMGATPTSVQIDTAVLQNFADELKSSLVQNLNNMTGAEFSAQQPIVEVVDRDRLLAKLPEVVINVLADFSTGLTGDHLYILAPEFSQKIVSLMNKEENADIDDMALSIIAESVSSHTNNEIQALEKTGKLSGIGCNPAIARNDPKAMIRVPQNQFVLFNYPLMLDGQAYNLWEAVSSQVANQMSGALGGNKQNEQGTGGTLNVSDMMAGTNMAGGGISMDAMQQSMNLGQTSMSMMGQNMGASVPNVQSLQYPVLQGNMAGAEQGNIGLIMDVFMEMTVELGRTKKQIKDILGMGEGTIIELDKLAGEPVDILVNHKPIAKGEVVVIDENFGVRVTEILSSLDRVTELH